MLTSPFTSAGTASSSLDVKNGSPNSYFRTSGYVLVSPESMLVGSSELTSVLPAHLDPVHSHSNNVNHETASQLVTDTAAMS